MDDALATVRGFNRFFTHPLRRGPRSGLLFGTEMSSCPRRASSSRSPRVVSGCAEAGRRRCPGRARHGRRLSQPPPGPLPSLLRLIITRALVEGDRWPPPLDRASPPLARRLSRCSTKRQRAKVEAVLDGLTRYQQADLVAAAGSRSPAASCWPRGRAARPLPCGPSALATCVAWIAARQSLLYRETYGWGSGIEVYIGEGDRRLPQGLQAQPRKQCWVARGRRRHGLLDLSHRRRRRRLAPAPALRRTVRPRPRHRGRASRHLRRLRPPSGLRR